MKKKETSTVCFVPLSHQHWNLGRFLFHDYCSNDWRKRSFQFTSCYFYVLS